MDIWLIDEPGKEIVLGQYQGFPMKRFFSAAKFRVTMKQHLTYTAELSEDIVGNIARINNALGKMWRICGKGTWKYRGRCWGS